MNEGSYDAKKGLLKAVRECDRAGLFYALAEYEPIEGSCSYPTVAGRSAVPFGAHDTDEGPVLTWRGTCESISDDLSPMHCKTAGLRERAYVLWDLDRIQRCGMLELFRHVPQISTYMYTEEDSDEM